MSGALIVSNWLYLHSPGNQVRAAEIFLDNLASFVRGEALRNEVA